jgi:hypothetical protein
VQPLNGNEQCTVSQPGHLDILVAKESNNVDCIEGCENYSSFVKETSYEAWDLVQCSFQINAADFAEKYVAGDLSECGR